ncbi:MAG: CDP-alcohol phosphatidyltransferase family protein [Candidatus Eiseniibacteriota bacterium]
MAERTVPDVATLREICHRGKLEKDRRSWYAASRGLAIYITWLLLHTRVTANQVTLMTVSLALIGAILLATPPAWFALCGACTLLAYHLLDKVDGDVARYRRTFSIVGVYLDEVGHGIAFAGLFLGLGLHLAWGAETVARAIVVLAAGGLGATAMVLARQHKGAGFLLYAQYVLVQPALMPEGSSTERPHPLSREGAHLSRRGEVADLGAGHRAIMSVRDTVLMLADFITLLVLVMAGLVVQQATGSTAFLTGVLVVGAMLQLAVLLALYWINTTTNIRSECLRLDALARNRAARMRDD